MDVRSILQRIEARLLITGLSAYKASLQAGMPDIIRNIQRGVAKGTAKDIMPSTLEALAPVLKTTAIWLQTGEGDPEAADAFSVELPALRPLVHPEEGLEPMAWLLEAIGGFSEAEAHVLARAVQRAAGTLQDREGRPLSPVERKSLVLTAIDLFRPLRR